MTRTRRLNIDLHPDDEHPPQPGDIILKPVAVYVVTEARPVDSSVWSNRWAITVRRIGTRGVPGWTEEPRLGARSWPLAPYPPGVTPAEWWAAHLAEPSTPATHDA